MFSYPVLFILSFLALVSIFATADPRITIHNNSPSPICYKVEYSSGSVQTTTTCDNPPTPGFIVDPGQSYSCHPTSDFNGAITAILNDVKGARHEINFGAHPGRTWYDVDYELGMSDSTLGPADYRPRLGGRDSLAGEPDILAKVNAAWSRAQNKAELLSFPRYVQGDDGKLTYVSMDTGAPKALRVFLQLVAGLNGYCNPGSIAGVVPTAAEEAAQIAAADEKSFDVDTTDMVINAY